MGLHAEWLENLAKQVEGGKKITPCAKALRRVAALLPTDPARPAGNLICDFCGNSCGSTCNGKCPDCFNRDQAAWHIEYRQRQDPAQFNMDKVVRLLLTQLWQHQCRIIPDYMPPFPGKDTRPTVQVCFRYDDGTETFLRHSGGPLQGYFWDIYGSDMHSPELALLALSQAPAPTRVGVVIPTHGN